MAATKTTLTPMQRTVLLAFPGGASAEGDNGASWTEVADLATATGLTKRQVMGVLSSLSTKGLIYADEEKANGEAGTLQCLTDEGARLVGMLTAEPVEGGATTDVPAPAPAPAPAGTIRVTYSSVDGVRKVHAFKTLKGARAFAQERVGNHPELGNTYAVAGDGIGKVTVEGVTLADLFPAPAAEPAAPTTWDACKTVEQVEAFAAGAGLTLAPVDAMAIVATFPGVHKTLRALGTGHWTRFPKSTPQEGTFVCFTGPKHGAIVVRDGKVAGPTPVQIVALWKAE